MKSPYKIDIHHHVIPSTVAEIFAELGNTKMGGIKIPSFDPKEDLAFMDRAQIKTAIVSLSDVGDTFKHEANARRIARAANEYYADLRKEHPGRYGAFATLPLPYIESAKQELRYALDELQLDGVMLLSNFEGTYLGDTKFDTVMAELNKRNTVVFVHPGKTPENSAKAALSFPEFMLEFVFDTSRAITNMIVNRIPERYPNIRFIFAHMGGTIPYLLERITLGVVNVRHYNPNISASAQEKIDRVSTVVGRVLPMDIVSERTAHVKKALKSFYFDTAVSSSAPTIQAVKSFTGLTHIVFGTDFSYAPEVVNQISQRLLDKSGLSEDEKRMVATNAYALFPQFNK
ncbi:MAG TPA: amidohydrolase family protein [Candidatus Saccharimonadales bacterium]|nr:amidohydrolase family protein [Candidatus Saccharimonadales bacterium]